jgi:hypothetical protein
MFVLAGRFRFGFSFSLMVSVEGSLAPACGWHCGCNVLDGVVIAPRGLRIVVRAIELLLYARPLDRTGDY